MQRAEFLRALREFRAEFVEEVMSKKTNKTETPEMIDEYISFLMCKNLEGSLSPENLDEPTVRAKVISLRG